jgi:hypothetical protein
MDRSYRSKRFLNSISSLVTVEIISSLLLNVISSPFSHFKIFANYQTKEKKFIATCIGEATNLKISLA